MKERVKVFSYVNSEGSRLIESELEDHINDWLAQAGGKLLHITQSESHRPQAAQHVTVCVWYLPEESASGAS